MEHKVNRNLEDNIAYLQQRFANCADVVQKKMYIGTNHYPIYVLYMDSMIDRALIEGYILNTLLFSVDTIEGQSPLEYIKDCAMLSANIQMLSDIEQILVFVLSGNTAIFGADSDHAIVVDGKGFPTRGIPTAESEVSVKGSKDSFMESIRFNTVLIRRRIRDTRLKTEQIRIGVRTKTDVALMYMEDLIEPKVLAALKKDLNSFKVDAILDSSNVEQYIEHCWYSPFPQLQATERPDKASSAIMEGRIVIVVDNSPMVLMAPTTLNCFFQASDDYYNRWEIGSFTRMLRYVAAWIAIGLPGLYIAAAIFHPEMFPTSFALTVAASRQDVPFHLAIEIVLMELAFELLREAGIRMPGPMGSALSIVGGLIVGQAAVEANIVSPIAVIVVALTALASFTIPNDSFASAFRLLKFFLIALGAFFGIPGFVMGMIVIFAHLASLESYGIPYVMPYGGLNVEPEENHKDNVVRTPLFWMRKRPPFTRNGARKRYGRTGE